MNTLYTSSSIVHLLRNVSPFVVPLQSRHVILLTTKSCFTRHYTTSNNITTRCLIAQPNSYLKKTSFCSVLRTSPSIVSSSLNRFIHHQQQHNLHYHSNLNTRRNPLICCCCTSLAPNPLHIVVPRNDLSTMTNTSYSIEERGARNSLDYRVYFKDAQGNAISPWHDIPLFADQSKKIYNMVVEIPRWTNAKMEIATAEPLNPIKQDVKKGALRYVRNPFPHKGYIWNYGAFPQTWEDPKHIDPATNAKGDNDPIDVLEIGQRVAARGEVLQVKILGTVALIDEGETDWKVLAINTADPLADQLNDIEDVEKLMPGLLRATVEWLKIYKIPDGKPANEFAFNGEAKNREFAEKVVEETAAFWKTLTGKESNDSGLDLKNTTLANGGSVKVDEAKPILEGKAASASVPEVAIADQSALDKSYFIKL